MMKSKVGIIGEDENDLKLINDLLSLMHRNQADYTNTFRNIMNGKLPKERLFNDQTLYFGRDLEESIEKIISQTKNLMT